MLESLEMRRLLTATAVLEDGVVKLTGTPAEERIAIQVEDSAAGPLLVISDTGTPIFSEPLETVHGIIARLGAGDDGLETAPRVRVPMRVYGEEGNDILRTGSGNDLLDGGADNDLLLPSLGADEFFGGAGIDGVSYAEASQNVRVTLDDAANDGVVRPVRMAFVSGDALPALITEGDNVHHDIEMVAGGNGNDFIAGVNSPRPVITPRVRFEGGPGNDVLVAGYNAEGAALIGGDGNDQLLGGPRRDYLDGGEGNDMMNGNAGADEFTGGAGSDAVSYSERTANLHIILDNLPNDGEETEGDNVHNDVERVIGGKGDDLIAVGPVLPILTPEMDYGPLVFEGGPGNDVLSALPPARLTLSIRTATSGDSLVALAPDLAVRITAILNGGPGADRLIGSNGNDRLSGGPDDDSLQGNDGNDLLDGGEGADVMSGGGGIDLADYSAREHPVWVSLDGDPNDGTPAHDDFLGEGDNVLPDVENVAGGAGDDRIAGSDGPNLLLGNGGDDILAGLGGNDTLGGGPGHDQLHGGSGNDLLYGRDGEADILDGGNDEDSAIADLIDTLIDVEHTAP